MAYLLVSGIEKGLIGLKSAVPRSTLTLAFAFPASFAPPAAF
jgi:hypothetical protein